MHLERIDNKDHSFSAEQRRIWRLLPRLTWENPSENPPQRETGGSNRVPDGQGATRDAIEGTGAMGIGSIDAHNPEIRRQIQTIAQTAEGRMKLQALENEINYAQGIDQISTLPTYDATPRAAIYAGSLASIPVGLAALSHFGTAANVVGGAGAGIVGALIGKKMLGHICPKTAPAIGAAGGILAAPAIASSMTGLGNWIVTQSATGSVASVAGLAAWPGGGLGGYAGYQLAERLGFRWVGKALSTVGGGIGGIGIASYLSSWVLNPAMLGPLGQQLAAAGTWLTAHLPTMGVVGSAAGSMIPVAAVSALGAGGLYYMGRKYGELKGLQESGVMKTILRGVWGSPRVLTHAAVGVPFGMGKRAVGTVLGTTARVATSPFRAVGGALFGGLGRGLKAGEFSGGGKVRTAMGAVPYAAGRILRAPYGLVEHLFTPWDQQK